tara:strand:+ start:496441 stop:496794 length:354 start_codon:yes stop_codon:yes gene_type:complete
MSNNKLYYDGQCPLCVAEMDKLGRAAGCSVELVDIHALTPDEKLPEKDDLLRTLHLQRADGEIVTGLDANVAAWQGTRYAALWRVLRWPLIRPVANACYQRWARWRYERLYAKSPPE